MNRGGGVNNMIPSKTMLAMIGLVLSIYAQYVEYKVDQQQQQQDDTTEFVALCDIEMIGASCSKVFVSPVGHLLSYIGIVPKNSVLDFSNASLGIVSYLIHLLLVPTIFQQTYVFNAIATTSALLVSIYLAYQLTFVLQDLCILCWTTHLINFGLFYHHVIAVYYNNIDKNKPLLFDQRSSTTDTTTGTSRSSTTIKEGPKMKRV